MRVVGRDGRLLHDQGLLCVVYDVLCIRRRVDVTLMPRTGHRGVSDARAEGEGASRPDAREETTPTRVMFTRAILTEFDSM